jgi:ADP-dependent NAD(P)H-hydrate dehydratase / NAD(P)H-hydrate epimerase
MDHPYWRRQEPGKALFSDIEWNKPERRDQAGNVLVVGGNKLGFSAVAEAYQTALTTGAGSVRVMLPDCLKKSVPATLLDVVYAACTPSGGLSKEAVPELRATAAWATEVLLIGDAGRNSETALAYEEFIQAYNGHLTVSRDAIDLVKNNPGLLAERPNTLLVASFAQVQKLFQGVFYPKMLTFNMQLLQFVEALHKFTITYPVTIMTLHKDTLVIAHNGQVITQPWSEPMALWRGSVATTAACYTLWSPHAPLEAAATSVVKYS